MPDHATKATKATKPAKGHPFVASVAFVAPTPDRSKP